MHVKLSTSSEHWIPLRYLLQGGANLSNFFIHTPICCPSRTTLLSGKFYHNNKVSGPNAGGRFLLLRLLLYLKKKKKTWQTPFYFTEPGTQWIEMQLMGTPPVS
jgi:arylsulfatase A-like enzyme